VNAIVRGEVIVAQCGSTSWYQRHAHARSSASGAFLDRVAERPDRAAVRILRALLLEPLAAIAHEVAEHLRSSFHACWTNEA
jgi:hypothetical protein